MASSCNVPIVQNGNRQDSPELGPRAHLLENMGFDHIISYDYHHPETFTGCELSLGSNKNVGVESLQGPKPAIPLRTPICAMSSVLRDLQHEVGSRFPKTD